MYTIREPKAAGSFYSSDKQALQKELETTYRGKDGPGELEDINPKGLIVPHDKIRLCGPACAWAYSRIGKSNYVIVGSNHFDAGSIFAIMKEGLWKTPLGDVAISSRVAQKILDKSELVDYDVISHDREHSVEVQLPFIQHRFGSDFNIVPIVIRNRFDDIDFLKQCQAIGKSVAQSIMTEKERWIIIGTTDMSTGRVSNVEKVDMSIIESMKNLNTKKFFDAVHNTGSKICGYGAVIVAMTASKYMGAKKCNLLKYMTANETVKGGMAVTGYASLFMK
jgi:AmmeMemoRadiSam system protein B